MSSHPRHVHLVGSIPLSTSKEVFQRLTTVLPGRLLRIPDGEPQKRGNFVRFQNAVFANTPSILRFPPPSFDAAKSTSEPLPRPIKPNPLMYDDFALESYREFCELREKGGAPSGIRFQVCLPTPFNFLMHAILPAYREEVEVLYEPALLSVLRRIQDNIPAQDLAIQWDMALEFAALEFADPSVPLPAHYPWISRPEAWFSPLKEGIVERVARLAAGVDEGVEMGFHLCYGDLGHRHFIEPKDSSLLVEMANLISSGVERGVNWIHMPVPRNRLDEEYYAPLKGLRLREETELLLGLAHAGDLEGTQRRIEMAGEVVERFGVATECGMGRMQKDEFENVLDVLAAVTVQT
jgi:hypothetical protein